MRVKIQSYGEHLPELEFGKRYYAAFAGITHGEEFVFTRKSTLELQQYEDGRKVGSSRISKRLLKQLIASGCIAFIAVSDPESEGNS